MELWRTIVPLLDTFLIVFALAMLAIGIGSIVALVFDWYEHGGSDGWNERKW